MTIRTAILEDVKDIAEIHVKSWQKVYKCLIPQSYLNNLSISKREKSWQNILTNSQTHTIVQKIDDLVVGFANFGQTRDRDKDSKITGEITSIYINPEYWRKGLGTEFVEFIFKDMRNQQFTQITLWVLDTNQIARKFYEKMGFQPDGATKTDVRENFQIREIRYLINLI
ncbi:acetyltransferase [Rivularia sp. PCC 7116]|uniref:GNAT family N-acetyltransferase n=1 Tax=Rivularia sp. PCC 7116 TaxID=373994 RepID=UPI00029F35BA|nr:GNAT family N-acetyltransferase [Rivularia sp. PCC 7116]AFY52636.1 acetyltransferase [Rivularia sp. PCC 7116]